MRSILTSVIVLLASSIAFAYPAVNDMSTLVGTATMQTGEKYDMSLEMKLTQFDAAQNSYFQVNTTTVAGNAQKEEAWVKASDLISADQVKNVLANCTQFGGRVEDVATKVGVFKTCAMLKEDQSQEATYWIGDVPFGIVKAIVTSKTEGYTVDLTVESFQAGK
ncbi:MAG: hypothetical protein AB7O96_14100 [Pseudobdellovibrionaceae bacterium]